MIKNWFDRNWSKVRIRGVARGAMPPKSSIEWIFTEKNWLCWDVEPAVLIPVIGYF